MAQREGLLWLVLIAVSARGCAQSVSTKAHNGVAYTAWVRAEQPGAWQTLRISLAEIRPNPYFQPPNAKTGAPLDVSEVTSIGFAPHDDVAGRFEIGGFVVGD